MEKAVVLGLFMAASLISADPVAAAAEVFRDTGSYSVTIRSDNAEKEVIRYFYRKPGLVRMEFITPHRGAVLVYYPDRREVRLRPFPSLKFFVLTLNPEDSLIKSPSGQTVDESDIGSLLENAAELQKDGVTKIMEDEEAGGRASTPVMIEGAQGKTVRGVHRFMLWFDKESRMPVKVRSWGPDGRLIEEVLMDGLKLDPEMPGDIFELG